MRKNAWREWGVKFFFLKFYVLDGYICLFGVITLKHLTYDINVIETKMKKPKKQNKT